MLNFPSLFRREALGLCFPSSSWARDLTAAWNLRMLFSWMLSCQICCRYDYFFPLLELFCTFWHPAPQLGWTELLTSSVCLSHAIQCSKTCFLCVRCILLFVCFKNGTGPMFCLMQWGRDGPPQPCPSLMPNESSASWEARPVPHSPFLRPYL